MNTVIYAEPQPIVVVNSAGQISISPDATKESLAVWIAQHAATHKKPAPVAHDMPAYGMIAAAVILVAVAFGLLALVRTK